MPFYRHPSGFTPLAKLADKKAIKQGLHHSVFTSNFSKYLGEYKNDKKEGKGYFLTYKGKLYEGDWYQGFRHGFGTLSSRLPNGLYNLEYRGDWVRGKPEGIGWRYFPNGDVYFGFWKKGYVHGYGKLWEADGTFYVGYWDMGARHGRGMEVQTNGNRYEGNWDTDKKHGLGRFYHMHTGQLQEGCWVDNLCVKSKMSDIIIRQFCDLPTEYPIPPHKLKFPFALLQHSELWLNLRLDEIDKDLKYCIDQMY